MTEVGAVSSSINLFLLNIISNIYLNTLYYQLIIGFLLGLFMWHDIQIDCLHTRHNRHITTMRASLSLSHKEHNGEYKAHQ
jgi:hypothetical protein